MTSSTCCGDDLQLDRLSRDNSGLPCGLLRCRTLQLDLPNSSLVTFCIADNPRPFTKDATETMLQMIKSSQPTDPSQPDLFDFTDDMVGTMIQDYAFGTVLTNLCSLYKREPRSRPTFVKCSVSLNLLLKLLLKESSVQATVPFPSVRALSSIVEPGVVHLEEYYSLHLRQLLLSSWGQPALVNILDDVLATFKSNGERAGGQLRKDCNIILSFLSYLTRNVTLSFPPDMRAKLLHKLDTEGVPKTEVLEFEDDDSDTGSDDAADMEAGEASNRRDYAAEYHKFFHRSGAHYPCWPQTRLRGVFNKDAKVNDECSSIDGGCDKAFCGTRGRTGDLASHTWYV